MALGVSHLLALGPLLPGKEVGRALEMAAVLNEQWKRIEHLLQVASASVCQCT